MSRKFLNDSRSWRLFVDELMKLTMRRDGLYTYDTSNIRTTVQGQIYTFTFKNVKIVVNTSKNPRIYIDDKKHVVTWPYQFYWKNDKFYIGTKDGEVEL